MIEGMDLTPIQYEVLLALKGGSVLRKTLYGEVLVITKSNRAKRTIPKGTIDKLFKMGLIKKFGVTDLAYELKNGE